MSDTTTTWRPAKQLDDGTWETPGTCPHELDDHESCTDPGCTHPSHLPERDDTANRSWLDHQGFLDDFETEEEEWI